MSNRRISTLLSRIASLEDASRKAMYTTLATTTTPFSNAEKKTITKPPPNNNNIISNIEKLENRVFLLEAKAGLWGEDGKLIVDALSRLELLEKKLLRIEQAHASEPVKRVISHLEALNMQYCRYDLIQLPLSPDNKKYYEEMTLSERAEMLGAPSPRHLCKTILMTLTAGGKEDSFDENGGEDAMMEEKDGVEAKPENCFLILLQYTEKIDTKKLMELLKENKMLTARGVKPCLASPARAKTLMGFEHNGMAPVGGFFDSTKIRLLISHEMLQLSPPVVYLGGGEENVKLRLSDVPEFANKTNAIVGDFTTVRVIGAEGRAFVNNNKSNQESPSPNASSNANINKQPPPNSTKGGLKRKERESDDGEDDGGGGLEIDFNALDVRVGKVVKAWKHPESDKLMCEEIDLGESTGPRQIASGIQKYITPEEFTGKHVLVVCNLKPAKLGGFTSNGMVLAASWKTDLTNEDVVKLVETSVEAKIGDRLVMGGNARLPAAAAQVKKKKIFETVAPKLSLDKDGHVVYENNKLTLTNGAGLFVGVLNGKEGAKVS